MQYRIVHSLFVSFLFLFFQVGVYAEESDIQLLAVSPDGSEVEDVNQLSFNFNSSVVAAGRMERNVDEVPITISPELNCAWRWLTTKQLICNLAANNYPHLATKYYLKVKTLAAPTEESKKVESALAKYLEKRLDESQFVTKLPQANNVYIVSFAGLGLPKFKVYFNQVVRGGTVHDHVYFSNRHQPRVSVELVPCYEDEKVTEHQESFCVVPSKQLAGDNLEQQTLAIEPGVTGIVGPEAGTQKEVLKTFYTHPNFKVLGIRCCVGEEENSDEWPCRIGKFKLVERNTEELCDSQGMIEVAFSSAISKDNVVESMSIVPQLGKAEDNKSIWDGVNEPYESYYDTLEEWKNGFGLSFPYGLKAHTQYHLKLDSKKLKDNFGRTLGQDVDLHFHTRKRFSRLVVDNQMSVLEKDVDSHLPIAAQNLKTLILKYDMLTKNGVVRDQYDTIALPEVQDLSFYVPLKLRSYSSGESAIFRGTIASVPKAQLGKNPKYFVSQVTPFEVHVKLGYFNTMVWVSRFADGKPVQQAKVSIYKGQMADIASNPEKELAVAKTDKQGIAILPGLKDVDDTREFSQYEQTKKSNFFIRVDSSQDFAVLPLLSDFSLYPYSGDDYISRTYGNSGLYSYLGVWGMTPQGIYRIGQTIEYKIFVRDQNVQQFIAPPKGPYTLNVEDPLGKVVHSKPGIYLSDFGSFAGEFKPAENAPAGYYRFRLAPSFVGAKEAKSKEEISANDGENAEEEDEIYGRKKSWEAFRVLVTDFQPPSFKVVTDLKPGVYQPNDKLEVVGSASYYSGGPFGGADLRLRARVYPKAIKPKLESFKSLDFPTNSNTYEDYNQFYEENIKLDSKGQASERILIPEIKNYDFGRLSVESAVKDERGKYISKSSEVDYAGRSNFLGLKALQWSAQTKTSAGFKFGVINKDGEALVGVPVRFEAKRYEAISARVKGPGNAYLTETNWEWITKATAEQHSGADISFWSFIPVEPGYYKVLATIKDSHKRELTAESFVYVIGEGNLIWEEQSEGGLDLAVEKKSYKVGDKVKLLVKNPLPGAEGLVTLERYGVIRQWTQKLTTNTPIIEFEITPDLLPGFYASVVAFSPRVDKPIEGKALDLGKPVVRMGYIEVKIEDPYKELNVQVKSDKESYRPREQVILNIEAKTKQNAIEPMEFAVAVVDQAVYDLIIDGDKAFDPYPALYQLHALDVKNYDLLLKLIGRRLYEKKGANPGGDGFLKTEGRSRLKLLAYWNPTVAADNAGRATISFELPDNLTSWRAIVVAVTKQDRFGHSSVNFISTQPTEIRAALPNFLAVGDKFKAKFSVLNRMETTRELISQISHNDVLLGRKEESVKLSLNSFERQDFTSDLIAGTSGSASISATSGDKADVDKITVSIPVTEPILERTVAVGFTVDDKNSEQILNLPIAELAKPAKAILRLSPSLIGGLDGAFRYAKDYPYGCWEQKLTKGLFAESYLQLREYLPADFGWQNADELAKETINSASGYQAPSGGFCYYRPTDDFTDPYLTAFTALAAAWLKIQGKEFAPAVMDKIKAYGENLLKKNVLPDYYSKEEINSVRATFLNAFVQLQLIESKEILPFLDYLPRFTLFGKAQLLSAASNGALEKGDISRIVTAVFNSSQSTPTSIVFQEDAHEGGFYWKLLGSDVRDNCAVISAMVAVFKRYGAIDQLDKGSLQRMVNGVVQKLDRSSHWGSTQDNLYCMMALSDYAKAFETVKPKAVWKAQLNGNDVGSYEVNGPRTKPMTFEQILPQGEGPAKVQLDRNGIGSVFGALKLNYTPRFELFKGENAGLSLVREFSVYRQGKWQKMQLPLALKIGDVVRVDLFVSVPADSSFVVVRDFVSAGLEPINKDLAISAQTDLELRDTPAVKESLYFRQLGWSDFSSYRWGFYHQATTNQHVTFYSEYLTGRGYHLWHVMQPIAEGTFHLLPAHAEKMYEPEVFGDSDAGMVTITQ